ncbi:MAG: hypothetical protein M1836_005767 [Candelina mexicana]|nr:MAG: hypothetical protein M1836_005767 [Candelina mexicana]
MSTRTTVTTRQTAEDQKEKIHEFYPHKDVQLLSLLSSIWIPRLILGALLTTTTLLPSLYEPFLSNFYSYLQNSPTYTLSTFETIETVLSYATIEGTYNYIYLYHPHLRFSHQGNPPPPTKNPSPLRPPHKRLLEILTYITPLLLLDFTLIKKYADVTLASILASGNYPPLQPHQQSNIHATFLAPTLHNFTPTSPLQTKRALPPTAPSSRRLTLELILSLLIYDTLFFISHLLFHTLPLLQKHHLTHHIHHEIHPQITNQLSVIERLSLVLLANFSLNIIGSHVLTRTLFVPVFVYLLVEVHCGMDLPWAYDRILPRGWGAGARKHAEHHRTGTGGYEPFFEWWDRGLGLLNGKNRNEVEVLSKRDL